MTAKEWKQKTVVKLELPSGMVIQARRPGPAQFMQWDRLPLMLATFERGGIDGCIGAAEVAECATFLRDLLVYCCVEPRVSVEPKEDEIHPRDIPGEDWKFIVEWALRGKEAAAVRPFRGERADVGGAGDGEAVFMPAVGTDGNRGSGAGAGVRPGGGGAGDSRSEG